MVLDEGLEARDRFVESGYEGERFRHKGGVSTERAKRSRKKHQKNDW